MRARSLMFAAWLVALGACSLIEEFDGFTRERSAEDGGEPTEDASTDVPAEVRAEPDAGPPDGSRETWTCAPPVALMSDAGVNVNTRSYLHSLVLASDAVYVAAGTYAGGTASFDSGSILRFDRAPPHAVETVNIGLLRPRGCTMDQGTLLCGLGRQLGRVPVDGGTVQRSTVPQTGDIYEVAVAQGRVVAAHHSDGGPDGSLIPNLSHFDPSTLNANDTTPVSGSIGRLVANDEAYFYAQHGPGAKIIQFPWDGGAPCDVAFLRAHQLSFGPDGSWWWSKDTSNITRPEGVPCSGKSNAFTYRPEADAAAHSVASNDQFVFLRTRSNVYVYDRTDPNQVPFCTHPLLPIDDAGTAPVAVIDALTAVFIDPVTVFFLASPYAYVVRISKTN